MRKSNNNSLLIVRIQEQTAKTDMRLPKAVVSECHPGRSISSNRERAWA